MTSLTNKTERTFIIQMSESKERNPEENIINVDVINNCSKIPLSLESNLPMISEQETDKNKIGKEKI